MLLPLRIAAPHGSDHLAFVQRGARQQAPLDMVSQVEILRVTILWHMLLLPRTMLFWTFFAVFAWLWACD